MDKNTAASILNIPVSANEAQIKNAYKQKAKEYHPDRPGGSKEKFQRLQQAYDKMQEPDQPAMPGGFNFSFNMNGGNPMGNPIFASMFQAHAQQAARGPNNGQSFVFMQSQQTFDLRPLLQGNIKHKDVQIPNWVRDGDTIRISQYERVQVRIKWPPGVKPYKTGRNDIVIKKRLSLDRALLGREFRILHPDGRPLRVRTRSIILQPTKVYKIDGWGLPGKNDSRGDLYLQFEVVFPDSLNKEQLDALKNCFPEEPLHRVHHETDVDCVESG